MSGGEDIPGRTVFVPATPRDDPAVTPPASGWPAADTPAPGWATAPAPAAETPAVDWSSPPETAAPPAAGWDTPPAQAPASWAEPTPPSTPPPAASTPPTSFDPQRSYAPMAPRLDGDRIQVGDVLNHIFEVRRFIARGGMGEVFEGINVSSDERVAIKVMLPALAADPSVQAMFRKEARTLTRLSHPALVQYRVLAQEPQLGVLYIVTEFIDGTNLSDVLGSIGADDADLRMLTRRLADGLRVAHSLGAIHRDISPDNVLLENGRLDLAKIIDFGIAKDLDPSSKTIVGDGFAGKLGYVAPEQLGDFGRDVGPWSDVYSLGLVILAVASGKNVDMGATLVDAVDRRRAGTDLTPIPASLRPVIEAMLKPDPAERLRSMEAVIAALDGAPVPTAKPAAKVKAKAEPKPKPAPVVKVADDTAPKSKTPMFAGIGVAVLLIGGAGAFLATRGGGEAPPPVIAASSAAPTASRDVAARTAINAALPSIGCSWLDVVDIRLAGQGVRVAMTGVADSPGRAQAAISKALGAKGITASDIDFEDVATVPASACTALDAFRSIRATRAEPSLTVAQRKWELAKNPAGTPEAEVILSLNIGAEGQGAAFFQLQENGNLQTIDAFGRKVVDRAALTNLLQQYPGVTSLGANRYRLPLIVTNERGWQGTLLLTGREPFDVDLIAAPPSRQGGDWRQRFDTAAQAGGWKAEMVWFKMVDESPG